MARFELMTSQETVQYITETEGETIGDRQLRNLVAHNGLPIAGRVGRSPRFHPVEVTRWWRCYKWARRRAQLVKRAVGWVAVATIEAQMAAEDRRRLERDAEADQRRARNAAVVQAAARSEAKYDAMLKRLGITKTVKKPRYSWRRGRTY